MATDTGLFDDAQDELDIDAMLLPPAEAQFESSICAMLVGLEDTLKSGIALNCRSKKQIENHEVVFVIDLDNANLPIWINHWKRTPDIRLVNPAVMHEVKQEDGSKKLEIDYDRTVQRINQFIQKVAVAEAEGVIPITAFVFDGVDKLLKSAEYTMRTQRELDIDDGVNYKYWNIRNKLFEDVVFAVKSLKCAKYFITHIKTYQKKKTDAHGKEVVVKEWDDGDWEKHTPNEMWQIIDCSKEKSVDGITTYMATVREFKGRPELVGSEHVTMVIDPSEKSAKFYGLPFLRDPENIDAEDLFDEE